MSNLTMLDRLVWRKDGVTNWTDGYDRQEGKDIGWVVTYARQIKIFDGYATDCWTVMYDCDEANLAPFKDHENIPQAKMTEEQLREYVTMKYLLLKGG